jgi:hypothetical protein
VSRFLRAIEQREDPLFFASADYEKFDQDTTRFETGFERDTAGGGRGVAHPLLILVGAVAVFWLKAAVADEVPDSARSMESWLSAVASDPQQQGCDSRHGGVCG